MDKTIKISDVVYKRIRVRAKKEKRSLKMIVEIAVCNYLQKKVSEK